MTKDIIDTIHTHNRPMPEIFQRQDIRNTGGWDVGNARAVRGEPFITVSGRVMRVPLDDSLLARAIRAHEQIHVKVSPVDISTYITDVTSEGAIRAAEEARVNYIAQMLGFPMKSLITGSEKFDGEQLASIGSWSAAVYAVAASVHTGSLNPLLVGVRRSAPIWADALRDIGKEIVSFQKAQIRNIKKEEYGVNRTSDSEALAVYGRTSFLKDNVTIAGMRFTIELAMLLESIASLPTPDQAEPEKAESEKADKDTEDDTDESEKDNKGNTAKGGVGAKELGEDTDPKELKEKKTGIDRDAIQAKARNLLDSNSLHTSIGKEWQPLVIKKASMPITLTGAIGRKRVASNIGRNPRRMHRILTDPDRRVFDKYVKASGGVILIDCSGSMSISKEELKSIMDAAPGCTVMLHAAHWRTPAANLYIVGEKGKICAEIPKMGGGNGNDLPAIQYAVSKRQTAKSPVLWVTDGQVYRPKGCGGEFDERECAEYAKRNRVHMEYNPAGAIKFLTNLQKGASYKPSVLERWKDKVRQR